MIHKLHEETLSLVCDERRLTGLVIENLQKISDSQLYLELGYSTLFEYCTKGLNYSEAYAYRRIQAVNVVRILPDVKEKLKSGAINLTNLGMAQSLITSDRLSQPEKREVLAKIENCSKREAEIRIADLAKAAGVTQKEPLQKEIRFCGGDEVELTVRISRKTLDNLDKFKQRRSHVNPNMPYAQLIEFLIEKATDHRPAKPNTAPQVSKNWRYISNNLKRLVWK